jgi:serine/threonine-protein kinase
LADLLAALRAALSDRYRIERELGAGGMATVYLAEDLKHHRRVAIKVLHPELSAVLGPDRFLKEIELTASLQHPHILPLFDSGAADGLLYYVMPFIEGETLRSRLTREQQLPIADALRIATDVASALDYAHKRGVVHRDIKPENILLHDGRPMVADFGIALAVQEAGGSRMTQTGMSLGTPQYMAPEQAMGERNVDARADVYALGAVTYEMLAGEPPFTGPNSQAIVAKILSEDPRPLTQLRKTVPPVVDAATRQALQKLPADRFATAGEFVGAMAGTHPITVAMTGAAAVASTGSGWRRVSRALPWGVALATSAVALWMWRRSANPAPSSPITFTLDFPRAERVSDLAPDPIAISPNGQTIVYVSDGRSLFVRPLGQLTAHELPGTIGAAAPFFSPDGRWVGFFNTTHRKLHKVPVAGGPVETVVENLEWAGAAFLADGSIVAGVRGLGLSLFPAGGGAPRVVTKPSGREGDLQQRYPVILEDNRTVLFTSWGGVLSSARIAVGSLDTGEYTMLDLPGTNPLGVFDSQLLYMRADGALMAVPIDLKARALTGNPVPVLEGVAVASVGVAKISISRDGSIVYVRGSNSSRLAIVDGHGAARPLLEEARVFSHPRYSPDGKTIALDIIGQSTHVWTLDLSTKTMVRQTTVGNNDRPEWSPDGGRLLYRSDRNRSSSLWWQPADGSAAAESLFATGDGPHEGVLAPDGHTLVYRTAPSGSPRDIWWVDLTGDKKPHEFLTSEFDELLPRLSPDGKWLAYSSNQSGAIEVYVKAFPGPSGRWQVSTEGGSEPVWARTGDRLFYRKGRQLVVATLQTTPGFAVLGREVLFEADYATDLLHANYDVAPNGKEFVMLAPTGDVAQVVVALHWAGTLGGRGRPGGAGR